MKITKFLTAPVLTLMFAAAGLAAAQTSSTTQITPYDVTVDSPTVVSGTLNTDQSWQTIVLPISTLGGSMPADLALDTSGLPDGLSVTLANVAQDGNDVVLSVDVTKVKELTLVVDFGPGGDVQDDVNFADARLVE